jgi:hypothetical protein
VPVACPCAEAPPRSVRAVKPVARAVKPVARAVKPVARAVKPVARAVAGPFARRRGVAGVPTWWGNNAVLYLG